MNDAVHSLTSRASFAMKLHRQQIRVMGFLQQKRYCSSLPSTNQQMLHPAVVPEALNAFSAPSNVDVFAEKGVEQYFRHKRHYG